MIRLDFPEVIKDIQIVHVSERFEGKYYDYHKLEMTNLFGLTICTGMQEYAEAMNRFYPDKEKAEEEK